MNAYSLASELYQDWSRDPLNYATFMEYVNYLADSNLLNEVRVYDIYGTGVTVQEWPNIACCAIASESSIIRKSCIDMFCKVDPSIAVPFLSYVYFNTDSEVISEACVSSVSRLKCQDAIPFLTMIISSPEVWPIRVSACQGLGMSGRDEAVTPLSGPLFDPTENECVRTCAAQAMGELRSRLSMSTLISVLLDKGEDEEFRMICGEILADLDWKPSIRAFEKIRDDAKAGADGYLLEEWSEQCIEKMLGTVKQK